MSSGLTAVLRRRVIGLSALLTLLFALGLVPSAQGAAEFAATGHAGKASAGASNIPRPVVSTAHDVAPAASRGGQSAHGSFAADGDTAYRPFEPRPRWAARSATQGWRHAGRGEAHRGRGPPARV